MTAPDAFDSTYPSPDLAARARALYIPQDTLLEQMENPSIVEWARDLIMGIPKYVAPLRARVDELHPEPTSRMAVDGSHKPLDPPYMQISSLLGNSIAHLSGVPQLLDERRRPTLATLTLIRVAIEASSIALWLMRPHTITARIKRSILLTWYGRMSTDLYTAGELATAKPITAVVYESLNGWGKRRGLPDLKREARLGFTEIVREAAKGSTHDGVGLLRAWQAGSGIAHSNQNFVIGSRSRLSTSGGGAAQVANIAAVGMMLDPAREVVARAVSTAEHWCKADRRHSEPRGHLA